MIAPATRTVRVGELVFDVATWDAGGGEGGEAAILLHGFPETHACWSAVAPLLAKQGLRVIAPDQRGYSPGARPNGVEAYAIDRLVSDVIGLMDAIGLERTHVVGHDWGAAVGWFTAAWHPSRVQTLTAVSVPHPGAFARAWAGDADQQRRSSYIASLRRDGVEAKLLAEDARRLRASFEDAVPGDLVERHVRRLSEPGALTAALCWYRAMDARFRDCPPVAVPTTYVWSDGDAYLGRAAALGCSDFVTRPYRFVELADVTHWIPEEAPRQLAEAVVQRVLRDRRSGPTDSMVCLPFGH